MPISYALLSTDDEAPPPRRRRTRGQMMGEILMKQATSTEPVYSPAVGALKVAAGGLAGLLQGMDERKERDAIDNLIRYGDPQLSIPPGALSRKDGALSGLRGELNATL